MEGYVIDFSDFSDKVFNLEEEESSTEGVVNYKIEEDESSFTVDVALPGFEVEDISVEVRENDLCIETPEGLFNEATDLQFKFNYKVKPYMVTAELESGILTVEIMKPEDYSFKVEID